MRVLAIVHEANAGPGVFAEAIVAAGGTVEEWMLPTQPEPPGDPFGYDGVIVLGGAMHVDQEDQHAWLAGEKALVAELLERERPVMGLCLGVQLLAEAGGAPARRLPQVEIGWNRVELTEEGAADPLLAPLAPDFLAFQWHSYEFLLPPGAVALARSEVCLQAARFGEVAWGLQFHPEVTAADLRDWLAHLRSDPDAVATGVDPAALGAESERRIGAFNQLGREICRRWLEACRR